MSTTATMTMTAPARYDELPYPVGTFTDIFERQAINMTMIHNIIIRSLNALLYYAPRLAGKKDIKDFVSYAQLWIEFLHHHHDLEEHVYFPYLSARIGATSMEHNIEQHLAFAKPLAAFETYLTDVQAGRTDFAATELKNRIHALSPMLIEHLREEIPTLSAETMRARLNQAELEEVEKQIMAQLRKDTKIAELPILLVNQDHASHPEAHLFPGLPFVLDKLARNVIYWKHSNLWRFGACDRYGRLKPFLAEPEA